MPAGPERNRWATAVELMTVARCAGRNREVIVKFSTLPSRAPVMTNATCRKCHRAADASPYRSSHAADIMTRALTPSSADTARSLSERNWLRTSKPFAQQRLFG